MKNYRSAIASLAVSLVLMGAFEFFGLSALGKWVVLLVFAALFGYVEKYFRLAEEQAIKSNEEWKKRMTQIANKKRIIQVCFPAMKAPEGYIYTADLLLQNYSSDHDLAVMSVAPFSREVRLSKLESLPQEYSMLGAPPWRHIQGSADIVLLGEVYKVATTPAR